MRIFLTLVLLVVFTHSAFASGEHLHEEEPMPEFTTPIISDNGEEIGTLTLTETHKGVLLYIEAENLGGNAYGFSEHAMHFHEKADCSPLKEQEKTEEGFKGAFTNTGGHYNLYGKDHGFKHHHGAHEGDMPNIFVHKDGTIKVKMLNTFVTLKDNIYMNRAPLFDADGSALIIHAGEDDYKSQPSGAAGPRIACASIKASDAEKEAMGTKLKYRSASELGAGGHDGHGHAH